MSVIYLTLSTLRNVDMPNGTFSIGHERDRILISIHCFSIVYKLYTFFNITDVSNISHPLNPKCRYA